VAQTRWSGVAAEFIPVADETGLIVPMNEALLRTACQQLDIGRGSSERIPR